MFLSCLPPRLSPDVDARPAALRSSQRAIKPASLSEWELFSLTTGPGAGGERIPGAPLRHSVSSQSAEGGRDHSLISHTKYCKKRDVFSCIFLLLSYIVDASLASTKEFSAGQVDGGFPVRIK